MKRVVLFVGALPGCVMSTEESFTVHEDLVGVAVEMSNGDVSVEPGAPGEAHVDLDFGGVGFNGIGHAVEDGVLVIDLRCAGACGGDLSLAVPPGAWVDVRLSAGDVSVDDVDGSVRAHVGAGAVDLWNVSGEEVDLATGAGSIDAVLEPEVRAITADAGAGDATLLVDGGAWQLELDAGAGNIHTDGVHDQPDSDRVLVAQAGAGSVSIIGE